MTWNGIGPAFSLVLLAGKQALFRSRSRNVIQFTELEMQPSLSLLLIKSNLQILKNLCPRVGSNSRSFSWTVFESVALPLSYCGIDEMVSVNEQSYSRSRPKSKRKLIRRAEFRSERSSGSSIP